MRGRKRLRKKMQQRMEKTPKIVVQLDYSTDQSDLSCSNLVERFRLECLKPIGLLLEKRAIDSNGWSGIVNPQPKAALTEKHRESIADWLFRQHEICTYAVGQLLA